MSIKLKFFSVIAILAGVIYIAETTISYRATRTNLTDATEQNLMSIGEAASALVDNDIEHLKNSATAVAFNIMNIDSAELPSELRRQAEIFKDFSSLDIILFDENSPNPGEEENVKRASRGETVVSSKQYYQGGKTAFFVYTPMKNSVLRAAVDGARFSDLLSRCGIWNAGYIFMDDGNGTIIASARPNRPRGAESAADATQDSLYNEAAEKIVRETTLEKGAARFSVDGKERLFAYLPVNGAAENWSLGVMARVQDSQFAKGLWGFAALALGSLAALTLYNADKITKQFTRIAGLHAHPAMAEKTDASDPNANWDFLANMSNEMRTPLNAIIGLSEMSLDSGRIQKEDYEILEKIYNSGVILSNFMNDISEVAKIEHEKFDLVSVEYETPNLINDVISINLMRIENKPVKFNLHMDESFPLRLWGDKLKVKYIFNNILSNAFKYTHKGSVDWCLYCKRDEHNDKAVWIVSKVRDTGIGIDEDDIGEILSSCHKTESNMGQPINSARLGISLTKRLVEMMQGDIRIESECGAGSVFTTRIRQIMANENTIGYETARDLKSFHYVDPERHNSSRLIREYIPYASVLVVDDIESNLEIAREILKPYGMRVDCVDSGQAAIELIMEEDVKYDAILLDYVMPGMDGIETTRLIRKIGTEYANNIPIIALSSNKTSSSEEMFLKKGFQAFLTKPVDITLLNNIINHWVRDRNRDKRVPRANETRPEHQSADVTQFAVSDMG
jgi:signal transduction histidine kinase/FixJ family two-component response regulator